MLILLLHINISSIILEGDYEVVIKSLISDADSFATYDHLINKVKIPTRSFIDVSFFHIRGHGNFIAHNIDRFWLNLLYKSCNILLERG